MFSLRRLSGWYDDWWFRKGKRHITVLIEQPDWFGFPAPPDGERNGSISWFKLSDEIIEWLGEYCEGLWHPLLDIEKKYMFVAFSRDVDAVKFRLMHFEDKVTIMHSAAYVWTKNRRPRIVTEEDYRMVRTFW